MKIKIIKEVTLNNGIEIRLIENENKYQIATSVNDHRESFAHLGKAIEVFNKRVKLYSRFVRSAIY